MTNIGRPFIPAAVIANWRQISTKVNTLAVRCVLKNVGKRSLRAVLACDDRLFDSSIFAFSVVKHGITRGGCDHRFRASDCCRLPIQRVVFESLCDIAEKFDIGNGRAAA